MDGGESGVCGAETECESGSGRGPRLERSGLPFLEDALSVGGLGDMGTFHKLASSGRSSSESWYSSSNSFTDLRIGFHDAVLAIDLLGERSFGEGACGTTPLAGERAVGRCPGDGDRDCCREGRCGMV